MRNQLAALLALAALALAPGPAAQPPAADSRFGSYVVAPARLRLFYKDERGRRFGSIERLKGWLAQHHQTLAFATNGGMYAPGGAPKGLFIQGQKLIAPLDTAGGAGNFYLRPNGVFYLTTGGAAGICATGDFGRGRSGAAVAYATQSGPLLVHRGRRHPAFTQSSANVVVRNGVGVLPDGRVVFAISRGPVSFYEFAAYFQRLGCREALYLDGFVSRLYAPAQGWRQADGDFGVIIAEAAPAR